MSSVSKIKQNSNLIQHLIELALMSNIYFCFYLPTAVSTFSHQNPVGFKQLEKYHRENNRKYIVTFSAHPRETAAGCLETFYETVKVFNC